MISLPRAWVRSLVGQLRSHKPRGQNNNNKRKGEKSASINHQDFPDGPVVKDSPCNAGYMGSIPGWETKIPQASGQLNPCGVTIEPAASEFLCHNEDSACCN